MRWSSAWPSRSRGRLTVESLLPESPSTRLDATVRGRVQGVGFRYFVLREAMDLDLEGWVANTRDGSVRCVAEGPRDRLDVLLELLRAGPPAAIVDHVSECGWRRPGGSAHSRYAAGTIAATEVADHRRRRFGTAGLFRRPRPERHRWR